MINSLSKEKSKFEPLTVAVWAFRAAGFNAAEEIVSNDGSQVFLFDGERNRFALLKRGKKFLSAISATVDDILKVSFRIKPDDLKSTLRTDGGRYALGGALIGGIPGAIVGSLLDGLRSPKLKDSVFFELTAFIRLKNGSHVEMKVVDNGFGYGMTKDAFFANAESVSSDIQNAAIIFSRWFESKIVPQSQETGEQTNVSGSAATSTDPLPEVLSRLSIDRVLDPEIANEPPSESAIDREVISFWERLIPKSPTLFPARDIPAKKLENAKAAYSPLAPEDKIVGLLDGTVMGSAKQGAVFTTRFFIWKWAGKSGRLNYADINTAKLEGKYRWPDSTIVHDGNKIPLNARKKELQALVSFIVEANRIIREN